jgi:DNA-binding NtrC family response regulator
MDGLTLLTELKARYPQLCTIMISAYGERATIRQALDQGAYDFLTKPLNFEKLQTTLDKAIREAPKASLTARHRFGELIGRSPAMQEVYGAILNAAAATIPVVIHGETGTGKDLVARTIHHLSDRHDQTFVPVNCGAIPETLFESELFGYRRGAFTGAQTDKPGLLDTAHLGTLFLDEVAELRPAGQVKFLRMLQTGEYHPVGSPTLKHADIRIICATNRHLPEMVGIGAFRDDLFYRLHGLEIRIPPLRERAADLPDLCMHFLEQWGLPEVRTSLSKDVLAELYQHDWPGNIRELHSVLQRYVATEQLTFASVRSGKSLPPDDLSAIMKTDMSLNDAMGAFEKQYMTQQLMAHQWNRKETAAKLGIDSRTLRRKIRKYQIIKPYQRSFKNAEPESGQDCPNRS